MSDTKKPSTQREPLAPRDIESPEGRARREGAEQAQGIAQQSREMTEQTQAQQSGRQVAAETQRTAEAAIGTMAHTGEAAAGATARAGEAAAGTTARAGEAALHTAARTAEAASTATQHVIDRGQAVARMAEQATAEVGEQVMGAAYGRSRHMLASATHVSDIYRDTVESTAEQMRGLFTCYLTLGRGAQQIQHAMLNHLNQAVGQSTRKPQDLLHCKSVVEVAEMQRDLYLGAMNYAVESSSLLLQMTTHAVQDAMRPLQGRS